MEKNKLKEMSTERSIQNYPINYHRHLKRNVIACTAITQALYPNPYYAIKLVSVFLPVVVARKAMGF